MDLREFYKALPYNAEAYVITLKEVKHQCNACQGFVEHNQKCSIICGKVCCQCCSSIFGINITYENGLFSNSINPNCFGPSKISNVNYVS